MFCVRSAARVTVRVPELSQPPVAQAACELLKVRTPDAVVLPVSPLNVTMGLAAARVEDAWQLDSSGTLGWSCTVMVFPLQGQGVLWLAVAIVHTNGVIMSGDAVFQLPAFELRLAAVMYGDTSTDTLAAPCAVWPFVRANTTVYGEPATRDWADGTVSTKDPALRHAPVDPKDEFVVVIPRVVFSAVVDPVKPVNVTLDCTPLHKANTGTLLVMVMVMVFEAHG